MPPREGPTRKPRRVWIPLLLVLGSLAGLAAVMKLSTDRLEKPDTKPALAVSVPKSEGDESGGLFKVSQQRSREPVISIRNGCSAPLKLDLMDTYGRIRTEWFAANSTREFETSPGDFQATIAAPDDPTIQAAVGEVKVKEFHHYQAYFVVGNEVGATPFYIGD